MPRDTRHVRTRHETKRCRWCRWCRCEKFCVVKMLELLEVELRARRASLKVTTSFNSSCQIQSLPVHVHFWHLNHSVNKLWFSPSASLALNQWLSYGSYGLLMSVCSKILQTPNMSKLFPEPGLSEETRTRVAWRRETSCQKNPKGLVPALRHTWRLLFGKWGTSHVMPQVQLPCQYASMLYSYLLIVWTSNLHFWVVSKESVKLSKRCTEELKVQEGVRHFRPEAEMASDIAARRHVWAQNTVCQTDIQSQKDSCAHRATLRKSQGRSTSQRQLAASHTAHSAAQCSTVQHTA